MKGLVAKKVQLFALAGVLIAAIILVFNAWDRDEMLRVTLSWGRLASLPASADDFTIRKGGTMFTRSFRASFSAPLADVEQWLRNSPGTYDVVPETPSPGVRRFVIRPGGGAQRAEVTVDEKRGTVAIYVCWS